MLAFANELASRAARFVLNSADEPQLWTVVVRGRVVGSLVREAGRSRLAWFANADRRLASYQGSIDADGELDTLATVLSARLGAPVELQSLAV